MRGTDLPGCWMLDAGCWVVSRTAVGSLLLPLVFLVLLPPVATTGEQASRILLAREPLNARELRELVDTGDAWALGVLEPACQRRLKELDAFIDGFEPPDLLEEVVACVSGLSALRSEATLPAARALRARRSARLKRISARVLAENGDRDIVDEAFTRYFEEPALWREVLGAASAATGDVGSRSSARSRTSALYLRVCSRVVSSVTSRQRQVGSGIASCSTGTWASAAHPLRDPRRCGFSPRFPLERPTTVASAT